MGGVVVGTVGLRAREHKLLEMQENDGLPHAPEIPGQAAGELAVSRRAGLDLLSVPEAQPQTASLGAAEGEVSDLDMQPDDAVVADSPRRYFAQIGKVSLLNAEQEVDLGRRIEAGLMAGYRLAEAEKAGEVLDTQYRRDLLRVEREGESAKNNLIEANLRLVVSIAKRYMNSDMELLDVIQEGNLGLIRAVEKFDYTKGYKFSTYATWWIRQAITKAIADKARGVRIPSHVVDDINRMKVTQRLLESQGREASVEELAKELGITPGRVVQLMTWSLTPASLDSPLDEGDERTLGSKFADDDAGPEATAIAGLDKDSLEAALACLGDRGERVMRLRFGLDDGRQRTLDEVSVEIGLSRERIRQIEKTNMSMLRSILRREDFEW